MVEVFTSGRQKDHWRRHKNGLVRWPVGMPLVEYLGDNLLEIRSTLKNRIARVIVTVKNDKMILLHGFIKKEQKPPQKELNLAKKRLGQEKQR